MMCGPPAMGQAPEMMPMGQAQMGQGPPMEQGFVGQPMQQTLAPMGGQPMDPGFMGAPPMGAPPMQPGVGPVELMPMGVPSMMGAPPLMTQMGAAPAPMADLEKLEKKKRDHDER